MQESITVRVSRVVWESPKNLWKVIRGHCNGQRLTATGYIDLSRDHRYGLADIVLVGEWVHDPRYGRQFNGNTIEDQTSSRASLQRIIAQAHLSESAVARKILSSDDAFLKNVLRNPYSLLSLRNVRFKDVDAIAFAMGLSKTNPMRLSAWFDRTFSSPPPNLAPDLEKSAGCWMQAESLLAEASSFLEIERKQLDTIVRGGSIKSIVSISKPQDALSPSSIVRAESYIAEAAKNLFDECTLPPVIGTSIDDSLSEEQRRAIFTSCTTGISIITGAPGTGKTRCIREIAMLHAKQNISVRIAAPTGKAAFRLSDVVGIRGSTIHRLLGSAPTENGSFRFERSYDNPFTAGLIIIDEMSMTATELAGYFMRAVTPDNRVVFVGDPNQLPPVGNGQPLIDLIDSRAVPVSKLTRIFRQTEGSAIAQACAHVIRGNPSDLLLYLRSQEAQSEIEFIDAEDDADILNKAVSAIIDSPYTDKIGICPMNVRDGGTIAINAEIQRRLHPGESPLLTVTDKSFFAGDRVMQTRNDYTRNGGTGIFNGDIGIAENFDAKQKVMNVMFQASEKYTASDAFLDLLPAYCITIHKSQGSEWDHVVVAIPSGSSFFLTPRMLYTAFSRAKKHLTIVADRKIIQKTMLAPRTRIIPKTRLQWLLSAGRDVDLGDLAE